MKPIFLTLCILLCLFPASAFAQLTAEEHIGMENLNSLSVFGSKILYAHTHKAEWNARRLSSIVISDLDGSNQQPLTSGEYDYDPKWSPTGEYISFISYRNNLQQLYVIPAKGGSPQMASNAQYALTGYQWLDAQTLAYIDDEPRDSLLTAWEAENGQGYVVGTEFYTTALWTYDLTTNTRKKLTDGTYRIIEFDISSDGQYLAMVAARNWDRYEAIVHPWVEVIEISTGKTLYKFSEANALNHVQFSPDGKTIAFAGSTEGYASNDGLFVAQWKNGRYKNLTYDFDPTIENIQWLDDSRIAFTTPRNGRMGLYEVNLKGKIKTLMAPHWVIYDFQVVDKNVFFTASRSNKTNQLYRYALEENPAQAQPLTQLNAALQAKIRTTSSLLGYTSPDGTQVQGIVNYPPDYDDSQKYPLMVIPHGGPDAVVLDDFNWMGQFFADHGYVVLRPNFRGSIGYGRDFYAGNRNAFGDTDFADIMAGVDKLVELGIADEDKLVMGGWSYGGYMANWAITQTNRFKAAISVAGIANLVSLYGQHEFSNREIGVWEYKSLLIDGVENYRKASPLFFVKNAATPLLILHGDRDTISPTLQAWEMYRGMKDAGKEVKMILYPRQGHNISGPVSRRSVLKNWLAWANEHIGRE